MERPETRYAKSGDVHIAYQVVGHGPLDLVVVPGFVSHLEWQWEHPVDVCLTRIEATLYLHRVSAAAGLKLAP
jgi:hypothetical protein